MKATTIIIVIGILLLGGFWIYKSQKQSNIITTSVCENLNLEEIRTRTQTIDSKISSYTSTSKDIMDRSTEGGQQTDYVSNGNRVLVKQTFFGETGKSEVAYYLSGNKIFYVKKVNSEYLLPLSEDSSGKVKNTTTKEFLLDSDQHLCSWYQDKVLQENTADTNDFLNSLISGI